MSNVRNDGFRFGIEAEYLVAEADSMRPLWHHDLSFHHLNSVLESIQIDDLPSLDGMDLEAPHRKMMPYVVEGYHVEDADGNAVDMMPKGLEIRTPVCDSINQCLSCLKILHDRLEDALAGSGLTIVSLSHHPTEHYFDGPQYNRRYDFWLWAKEVMMTCGPDINVSLPQDINDGIDFDDLDLKTNYYAPALAALTMASPFYRGDLWQVRGGVGKSMRTHRRSVFAPVIELHPEEGGRTEFKIFEATNSLQDYHAYFLLWLTLMLDTGLQGRGDKQTRVYDLGAIARHGLEAETVRERANEVLLRAPAVLERYGFDPSPLGVMRQRLQSGRVPADDIIDTFLESGSLAEALRIRTGLIGPDVTSGVLDDSQSCEDSCSQVAVGVE